MTAAGDLTPEIEALQARLQTFKDRKPMKYALESLPELIGENQFRDLCVALGVDTVVQLPSGEDFASIIRSKVLKHHLDEARSRLERQQTGLQL